MRTIVELPDDQVAGLAELCERLGISRAEAVRRAVAGLLESRRLVGRQQAFGAWKSKGLTSESFVRGIRDEWAG